MPYFFVFAVILISKQLIGQPLFVHDSIKVGESNLPNNAGDGIIVYDEPIKFGEVIMVDHAIYSIKTDEIEAHRFDVDNDGRLGYDYIKRVYYDMVIAEYDKLDDQVKEQFDELLKLDTNIFPGIKERVMAAGINQDNELFSKYVNIIGRHLKYGSTQNDLQTMYLGIVKMNNNYPTNAIWLPVDDKTVLVVATNDIDVGDEVFIDYFGLFDFADHLSESRNMERTQLDILSKLNRNLNSKGMTSLLLDYFQLVNNVAAIIEIFQNNPGSATFVALFDYLAEKVYSNGINLDFCNFVLQHAPQIRIDVIENDGFERLLRFMDAKEKYKNAVIGTENPEPYMGRQFLEHFEQNF